MRFRENYFLLANKGGSREKFLAWFLKGSSFLLSFFFLLETLLWELPGDVNLLFAVG